MVSSKCNIVQFKKDCTIAVCCSFAPLYVAIDPSFSAAAADWESKGLDRSGLFAADELVDKLIRLNPIAIETDWICHTAVSSLGASSRSVDAVGWAFNWNNRHGWKFNCRFYIVDFPFSIDTSDILQASDRDDLVWITLVLRSRWNRSSTFIGKLRVPFINWTFLGRIRYLSYPFASIAMC